MCTVLLVFTLNGLSAQILSNGTGGGDWNTGSTWNGGIVPTSVDDVVIQSSDSVSLAAAGSCANLTMQASSKLAINTAGLSIPGTTWDLNTTSTVYFNGPTTVQTGPVYGNLTYSGANGGVSTTTPASLTINGNLTINGSGSFRGIATTSGSVTHTVLGDVIVSGASAKITGVNNSAATTATCTWNISGSLKLTGNSSNNRIQVYESAGPHNGSAVFNINGNLEVGASSQVMFKSSSATVNNFSEGFINIKGNFIQNGLVSSNSVTSGTSPGLRIKFNGTTSQSWSGTGALSVSSVAFPVTYEIDNSAGVVLGSSRTIGAATGPTVTLVLTNGKLTTTSTNLLTVAAMGVISGGSSNSFIDGPVSQTWSTTTAAKIYPLGKGSAYRPLEISLTTPASSVIRAEMFNGNPAGTSALDKISTVRYYQTALTSGTAASGGTVKMTYGADDGIQTSANLVVAQSTSAAGTYTSLGNSASDASTVTSGTGYNPASGDFLLMGSTGGNTLPVELTSFTAALLGAEVVLHWTTATETENSGFEVQKLINSQWKSIGFVHGAGNSNVRHDYQYTDRARSGSVTSYRLKQVDRNGSFTFSNSVEAVSGLTAGDYGLSQNYPNPFNPSTTFSFAMKNAEQTTVKVFTLIGEEVATLFDGIAQPNHRYSMTFAPKNLASGIYFYSLRSASRHEVKRMLLMK
jgi:hypothetical protein